MFGFEPINASCQESPVDDSVSAASEYDFETVEKRFLQSMMGESDSEDVDHLDCRYIKMRQHPNPYVGFDAYEIRQKLLGFREDHPTRIMVRWIKNSIVNN